MTNSAAARSEETFWKISVWILSGNSHAAQPVERLQEEIKVAVQETLDGLEENQLAEQATLEIDLFSRASATRARCLDHASKDCAWTTL